MGIRPGSHIRNPQRARVSTPVYSWLNFNPLLLRPVVWFDAADISTITSSGSPAKVSQWNDKSGNGYHVSQGLAAAQPTTGSTTLNGLNVISFNNNVLTRASVTINQPYTVIMVWKYDSGVAVGTTLVAFAMGELAAYAGYIGDAEYRCFNGTVVRSAAIANTDTHQVTSIHNSSATASEVRVDGVRVAGPASSGATNGSRLNIGAANSGRIAPLTGNIAEIIVVDRALTSNELQISEGYLRKKWATPNVSMLA